MRCFYQSYPTRRGYKRQMTAIWTEFGIFEITEYRLADQARLIKGNGCLTEIELEEVRRRVWLGTEEKQYRETNDMHVLEEIMQHENVAPGVEEISVSEQTEVTPSDCWWAESINGEGRKKWTQPI